MSTELRHVFYAIFISASALVINIVLTINDFYAPFNAL